MRLKFTKMHGAGNDFMMLDLITQDYELDSNAIRQWGNRHTGIGFDQLLVVEAPQNPDIDFCYRIFNTDGSEVEQCGNGARCFARFVFDQQLSKKNTLKLETKGGVLSTLRRPDGMIEVNMGLPGFAKSLDTEMPTFDTLDVNDQQIAFTQISMGNPHAVIFVDDVINAQLEDLGPQISLHKHFPEGTNVGFCEVVDSGFMRLRVYERGAGETLACGSGACAAVAAGILHNKLGNKVKVSLPGGKLRVNWPDTDSAITLIGQARVVYEGSIPI